MDLLVHGVYDASTLQLLTHLNVSRIGFDLRGRSLNLIPFHELIHLIPSFRMREAYLTFEDDKITTILSFLSLLGPHKDKFILEFRDNLEASFYASTGHDFVWFFRPGGDWKNILRLKNLRGVILPVHHRPVYQNMPELWQLIFERDLKVILHVETFLDLELYLREKNLTLSVDLGKEMEIKYRQIDLLRLSNLSIWRKHDQITSGQ